MPTFWIVVLAVLAGLVLSLWLGYSQARPARAFRAALAREVPIAPVRVEDPADLYYRPFPDRLQVHWPALLLGPFWYLLVGLWVHAGILLALVFVSGGLLAPVVWAYAGLKAEEDLVEARIARRNVY